MYHAPGFHNIPSNSLPGTIPRAAYAGSVDQQAELVTRYWVNPSENVVYDGTHMRDVCP